MAEDKPRGKPRELSKPGRNGGTLMSGGTNAGGPGRPPNEVRAAALLAYDKRMPILEKFADDDGLDPKVRIEAIKELRTVGLPTQTENSGPGGGPVKAEMTVNVRRFDDVRNDSAKDQSETSPQSEQEAK